MLDNPRALEAAWLAGYHARGLRVIAAIQGDRGGPEPDSFRHLASEYRDAVNSESQAAADAQKDAGAGLQAMLADACEKLAAAETEIVRLTKIQLEDEP